MGRKKEANPVSTGISERPRSSPEAQINKCIALSYDLVEQRLRDGTATSQETTYFLKLGSERERYERELLAEQVKLVRAKTEEHQTLKRIEESIDQAMNAVMSYRSPVTMKAEVVDD